MLRDSLGWGESDGGSEIVLHLKFLKMVILVAVVGWCLHGSSSLQNHNKGKRGAVSALFGKWTRRALNCYHLGIKQDIH